MLVPWMVPCSATGAPEQQVGTEGNGGKGGSGFAGASGAAETSSINTDGGLTNPFSVHIEHKQVEVKFITVSCQGSCADIVADLPVGDRPTRSHPQPPKTVRAPLTADVSSARTAAHGPRTTPAHAMW